MAEETADRAADVGQPVHRCRKRVKEVSYVLIGMSVLFGGLGLAALVYISPQAPPVHGLSRRLVFGIPLLSIASTQLLCGILFLSTNRTIFGAVGAVATAVVSVMAFVLTGFSVINALLAAVPILIAQRLSLIPKAKAVERPPAPKA